MNEKLEVILKEMKTDYLEIKAEYAIHRLYEDNLADRLIGRTLKDEEYECLVKTFMDWIFEDGRKEKELKESSLYLGEIPNVFDLGDYVLFKKEFAMSEEGAEYIQNKLDKCLIFYRDVVEIGDIILGVCSNGKIEEHSRVTEDCLFVVYRKSTEVFMSTDRNEFLEILLHDYEFDKKYGHLDSWGESIEVNARKFM